MPILHRQVRKSTASKSTPFALFFEKIKNVLYRTNFSKLIYLKPTSQLSRSKYRTSVRDPHLWNEFFNRPLAFKSKVKSKLLSYENEVIFS